MRAAVFDLDGTLIDSAPDIHAAANAALAIVDAPPLDFGTVRGFIGNGAGVLVDRVIVAAGLPADPAFRDRLLAAFLERYETAVTLTRLYPGVAAMLDRMAAEGWHLGLCTNKPEGPTRAVLRHFGLDRHFAALVGGDTLTVRKPDPAPLHAAIAALGDLPSVFVGDSEVDAETAQAAGVPFALFTGGYRKSPADALPHAVCFAHHDALPALAARMLPVPA